MKSDNIAKNTLRQHNFNKNESKPQSLCSLPSILEVSSETSFADDPILTFISSDIKTYNSLFSSLSNNSENNHSNIEKVSNLRLGCLKFLGLKNTSDTKFNRNKISIIFRVPKPDKFQTDHWPPCSFYGLYSAHYGNSCASFLKKNLHKMIFSDKNFPQRPKDAILNGFRQADEIFLKEAEEKCNLSGAFAIIVLMIGKKCYMANTGNCRGIVSLHEGRKIVEVSRLHVPENEEEKMRIIRNNGKVYRDYIQNADGELQEVGKLRISPGKKGYTRSFGDIDTKVQEFGGIPGTVISDPYIKSFKINDSFDFIGLVTQNLEDFSSEDIAEGFWRGVGNDNSNVSSRIENLFGKIREKNVQGNYSMMVIGLKELNNC